MPRVKRKWKAMKQSNLKWILILKWRINEWYLWNYFRWGRKWPIGGGQPEKYVWRNYADKIKWNQKRNKWCPEWNGNGKRWNNRIWNKHWFWNQEWNECRNRHKLWIRKKFLRVKTQFANGVCIATFRRYQERAIDNTNGSAIRNKIPHWS